MAEEITNAPNSWGSMPQRKPLPPATAAPETEAAIDQPPTAQEPKIDTGKKPYQLPFVASIAAWWAVQKRPRKFLIIGLTAGLLLIALIVGLAVGLTVGKK